MRAGSFSPDGSFVVTASDDGSARVWTSDGKAIATLRGDDAVTFATFSPDGRLVVTASNDGTMRLWRVPEGSLAVTLGSRARYAAFSPDGALLATASPGGTAHIWEVPSGRARWALALHADDVVGQVQFGPDGMRIATGSGTGIARIWTSLGEPMIRLNPRAGSIVSMAFSVSGRLLATGSSNKVAHVWDVATGAELARFGGHEAYVGSVAFNADGTRLLTASGKTPRLYDVHWLSRPGGRSLVAAVCREKLRGIGRITEEDSGVLRGLRGRVGEEVCPPPRGKRSGRGD
jgi:WD40 repeat protein